jgi:putative Mn2+ efflux pump MntP
MDAFAVSISTGMAVAPVTPRHVFRLAFHFGLFQCLMPILGWAIGSTVAGYLRTFNAWLAFALLSYVGGKMLWEAWRESESESRADPTRGMTLVTLCVATSIDAMAVGVSMALVGVSVWIPAVVIGLVTGALTTAGIVFGSRMGSVFGRWAETAGGCVLILIGLRVLLTA